MDLLVFLIAEFLFVFYLKFWHFFQIVHVYTSIVYFFLLSSSVLSFLLDTVSV